jgi:hypothetical protein
MPTENLNQQANPSVATKTFAVVVGNAVGLVAGAVVFLAASVGIAADGALLDKVLAVATRCSPLFRCPFFFFNLEPTT